MAYLDLSSVRLPSAFQECEWIKASSGAYIDTGIYPSKATTKFRVKAKQPGILCYVCGAVAYNSGNVFQFSVLDQQQGYNRIRFDSGTTGFVVFSVSAIKSNPYELEFGDGNVYYNGTRIGAYDTTDVRVSAHSMLLFASLTNSGAAVGALGYGETYFFEVENGGDRRDYIPCYLRTAQSGIPAGTIGMYDLRGSICPLTNTPFYINAGTGVFTKGPDVVHADAITIGGKSVDKLTDEHGIVWKAPGDVFVASLGNNTTGDGTALHLSPESAEILLRTNT